MISSARLKHRFDLGMIFGKTMKFRERQRPLSTRAAQVDNRAESRQRDAHIRWVRGYAGRRSSKNRVNAIEALDRVTALAGVRLLQRAPSSS